ncbi:nucleotide sugar dehydrogenase [Seonamhaeicola maritimus]|uniref:Nucleotide sugar dehydrogenase n=1 Tax=Seonamhaeicola maritimus TaxID=2591822 RepID=A0A5C7GHW9_9FLAO|nr:nucleotide sugar dehydrogenase [Seonamhaeicola maritimus]TXG37162.1 nucleotide sugar dehydrogenase [Seonamhaeicola maritimus]
MEIKNLKIAVVGLGYVGLPLGIEFSKKGFDVVGFDVNEYRVKELEKGIDTTSEILKSDFLEAKAIKFSFKEKDIEDADIYIVTVPTPIDEFNRPNLNFLIEASRTVGKYLSKGNIVIYESTVYPGCTEEVCVPELVQSSGLRFNIDFYCGYSPERINPGDPVRKVHNIVKITSGSTPEIANIVDSLYKSIVTVGTHKASSLKVAEAGKIIENIQRDLNISLMNELALIFDKLDIDTLEVLEAAGTKWNFLPFRPGLVGGHCIGVDPYYLTHKAESLGYHPDVILSGRRVNDNMGVHVANKVIKLLVDRGSIIKGAKILVLGITFKENCPDIRNSRVIDVVRELHGFGVEIDVYDPYAIEEEVKKEYDLDLIKKINYSYDAVVLAVGHDAFKSIDYNQFIQRGDCVIYDVKSVLPRDVITDRL